MDGYCQFSLCDETIVNEADKDENGTFSTATATAVAVAEEKSPDRSAGNSKSFKSYIESAFFP